MKIAITGQDTLAATARKCCSRHFDVVSHTDPDIKICWVCYDTPLDDRGNPDQLWVLNRLRRDIFELTGHPLILISSQMLVGTIWQLEQEFPGHAFAYSPENIRVAHAVSDFEEQARVVVGVRTTERNQHIQELFAPFTRNLIFTTPETAEMVKHSLNCYLGMSIAFINEIARVCAVVGADVDTVSASLLAERRISPKAPLKAGPPFGAGTSCGTSC